MTCFKSQRPRVRLVGEANPGLPQAAFKPIQGPKLVAALLQVSHPGRAVTGTEPPGPSLALGGRRRQVPSTPPKTCKMLVVRNGDPHFASLALSMLQPGKWPCDLLVCPGFVLHEGFSCGLEDPFKMKASKTEPATPMKPAQVGG